MEKEQKKQEKELKKKEKEDKKREKDDKKKGKSKGTESGAPLTASRLQLHVSETDSPRLLKPGQLDSASEISDVSSHVAKSENDSDDESTAGEAPGILLSPGERQVLYETIGFDQALADVLEEKLPPEVSHYNYYIYDNI